MKRLTCRKVLSVILAGILVFGVFSIGTGSFTASAATVTGDEIVEYARQYIGYPYAYGTHGPDSFDCSGFVYYVFNHFGISLPLSSYDYFLAPGKYGMIVNVSDAQAGDVFVWADHVGIYTSNGNVVNAANPTDGVVENSWTRYGSNPIVIRIYGVGDTSNPYNNGTGDLVNTYAPIINAVKAFINVVRIIIKLFSAVFGNLNTFQFPW